MCCVLTVLLELCLSSRPVMTCQHPVSNPTAHCLPISTPYCQQSHCTLPTSLYTILSAIPLHTAYLSKDILYTVLSAITLYTAYPSLHRTVSNPTAHCLPLSAPYCQQSHCTLPTSLYTLLSAIPLYTAYLSLHRTVSNHTAHCLPIATPYCHMWSQQTVIESGGGHSRR